MAFLVLQSQAKWLGRCDVVGFDNMYIYIWFIGYPLVNSYNERKISIFNSEINELNGNFQ